MKTLGRLFLPLLALSCTSTPTTPEGISLQTAYGTVNVWSDGSSYDLNAIREALERGQQRALAQNPAVPSLSGLTVAIYKRQVWTGPDSVGAYDPNEDTAFVLKHTEEVLDHEIQHRAAWKLGIRGDCFLLQDHSPGFDLSCNPR